MLYHWLTCCSYFIHSSLISNFFFKKTQKKSITIESVQQAQEFYQILKKLVDYFISFITFGKFNSQCAPAYQGHERSNSKQQTYNKD